MKTLNTLETTETSAVQQALQIAKNQLNKFATSADFKTQMQTALVNQRNWETTDLINFPAIEIRPASEINNARGAFAAATNTIYLSQELVNKNTGNVGAITSVLLEEYGHYLDAQINAIDSPGDEGELFANLVQGKALSQSEILALWGEDDSAIVVWDGEGVSIEQQVQSDTLDFFANDIPFKEFLGGTQSLLDDFLEKKKLTLPISAGPGRATIPLAGGGAGLVANVGFDYNVQGSIALFPFVQLGGNLGEVSRLSYPINIDAELPNAVSNNENFSIKTPYQVGKAEISGLGVNLPDAGIKIKHGFENFNLSNFSFVNK